MKNEKTAVGEIDRDVLAFTTGDDPALDLALVEWDCLGSAAHAQMLARMKCAPRIFTAAQARKIRAELARIAADARAGRFAITAADQDCHLAIERALTEKLGELGKKIHTGRSRNDQAATALRLYARAQIFGAADEALALAGALFAFAKKHRAIPMVGRTHFQPAMPSSVGLWASAYGEALLDDLIPLGAALEYANRCPLGSAASYGVPLPTDRQFLSDALGFDAPIHNVLAAGNSRGKTESVALSALCHIMLTLSRLAEDLVIFSAPEFGYFQIPKEFCTGSSIMPQKYNPDVCELIRAKTARLIGVCAGAAAIVKALPAGYNRDLQETKGALMDGFNTARASLRIMAKLVAGCAPCHARLRAAFEPGVFATDRALELVAAGTPFRDAYHQVRGNLGALEAMSPDAALAAKTHLGATAGLDFAHYAARARAAAQKFSAARRRADAAAAKLLPRATTQTTKGEHA